MEKASCMLNTVLRTVSRMISTVIEALCVGIMCAVCYRIGWNKGTDEARHVIMMMLQRGEQNDD